MISLHCCVWHSNNIMFFTLEYKSRLGERGRPLCMHSDVVWTMGRRGKKHTCLQINWFGQEASKEELCVVKQACGEAGMSQQKHHRDHREDHDAVLKDIALTNTRMHALISTNAHMQHLRINTLLGFKDSFKKITQ